MALTVCCTGTDTGTDTGTNSDLTVPSHPLGHPSIAHVSMRVSQVPMRLCSFAGQWIRVEAYKIPDVIKPLP
jgi:hypothetical protein